MVLHPVFGGPGIGKPKLFVYLLKFKELQTSLHSCSSLVSLCSLWF
jgi:hypothetical protein